VGTDFAYHVSLNFVVKYSSALKRTKIVTWPVSSLPRLRFATPRFASQSERYTRLSQLVMQETKNSTC
jgi:hypothetical protein